MDAVRSRNKQLSYAMILSMDPSVTEEDGPTPMEGVERSPSPEIRAAVNYDDDGDNDIDMDLTADKQQALIRAGLDLD